MLLRFGNPDGSATFSIIKLSIMTLSTNVYGEIGWFLNFVYFLVGWNAGAGNTIGASITVPLTSYLTGLE
jgi:hypothetical protein